MNSVKTAFVSLILLGVLYGMYQVLNTPPARFDENGYEIADASSVEIIDAEESEGGPIDPEKALEEFNRRLGGGASLGSDAATKTEAETEAEADAEEASSVGEESTMPPVAPVIPRGASSGSVSPPPGLATGLAPAIPRAPINDNRVQGAAGIDDSASEAGAPPIPRGISTLGGGSFAPPSTMRNPDAPPANPTTPPVAESPNSTRVIADAEFSRRLNAAWTLTDEMVKEGEYAKALEELSFFYGDKRLKPEEDAALMAWLDSLAAKVIYSTEPHIEPLYIVRDGDHWNSISNAFGVTPELLSNINHSKYPNVPGNIAPGLEIKVLTGPFRLKVEASRGWVTLMLGDRYAGRFALRTQAGLVPGTDLEVKARFNEGRDFESAAGSVPALAPENPLGRYGIELSDGTLIHESGLGEMPVGKSIGVSGPDALDLFSILPVGTRVTITE